MLARVFSAAVVGLDGVLVEVEVDIQNQGLPSFTIVASGQSRRRSQRRVRSAIKNTGCEFPQKRITVNLAQPIIPKKALLMICRLPWAF